MAHMSDESRQRRGSSFSDKQIAASVKDGKRVTAILGTGNSIYGYICGADDYHWGLVSSEGTVTLVHKSFSAMTISSESTIDGESKEVRDIVHAYRQHILRAVYGQTASEKEAS